MDLVLLGFLFFLSLSFILLGVFKTNPIALLLGGLFLVLVSALVFAVGYDVSYNPVDSEYVSTFTYDSNQLLTQANKTVFQVNSSNSLPVFWLSVVGMFLGSLLSLFSVLGLASRSGR